jgi:uncharacterized protein (TIRG00374 family)
MSKPLKSPAVDFIRIITGWRGLLLILGLVLAWHALRGIAWAEAWAQLTGIGPGALLILLALNLAMLPLMIARWWLVLRILGSPIGWLPLCANRCAANAVSYLTPGPHFGGEPLSIFLLHTRQGVALSVATTSVVLDRILEFLAGILVLILGLLYLSAFVDGPFSGGWTLPLGIALLVIVAVLLAALFTDRRPLSRLGFLCKRVAVRWIAPVAGPAGSWLEALTLGEARAATLVQRQGRQFLAANLFSLVHWLAVFAEFWLMAAFLGHPLLFWQLTALVITARLAFLTPLPAGLGALETALPWVTDSLGLGSTLGLSLCLIIRFRDLMFSLTGLGLTMKYLTCAGKAVTLPKVRSERREEDTKPLR